MSKLQDIFNSYGSYLTGRGDYKELDLENAEQAVKDLVLELIGEDDDLTVLAPLSGLQREAHGKNILRFTLRNKVEDL